MAGKIRQVSHRLQHLFAAEHLSGLDASAAISSLSLWVASGRVFASLAPGPDMASAIAVSALDPEMLHHII